MGDEGGNYDCKRGLIGMEEPGGVEVVHGLLAFVSAENGSSSKLWWLKSIDKNFN